ncbi:MAG: hypothetical protein PHU23_08695 [Dehalococcoidales bacterium]|nr:hypothetical protein [Dehalococcoidales bacterium]
MPIVKTEKINLNAYGLNKPRYQADFVIKYLFEPRRAVFQAKYPPEVAAALQKEFAEAKTFGEVREKYIKGLEQFKNFNITTKKVILYHISVGSYDSGYAHRDEPDRLHIDIEAGVFEEQETTSAAGDKHYDYIKVEGAFNFNMGYPTWSRSHRHSSQLPYTEENEKFFLYIAEHMRILIAQLHEIDDPAKLEGFINAGRLLPIGKADN